MQDYAHGRGRGPLPDRDRRLGERLRSRADSERVTDSGPTQSSGHARGREQSVPFGAALLPLRGFLGVTFAYAGVQKLSDPGFLHPGAPTYIGSQLHAFAQHTPAGFLLRAFAVPHATLAGIGVAVLEIAIGLLVLAGVRVRLAAVAGLLVSLVLFLSASWHAHPYFLGSDIVFVFAWVPFTLVGAAGQPSLERWLLARAQRGVGDGPFGRAAPVSATTRRQALARALAMVGPATVGLASVAALAKGRYRSTGGAPLNAGASPRRARRPAHTAPTTTAGPSTSAPTHRQPATPALPRGAVAVGDSSQVRTGRAAFYDDPSDGQLDVVVRQPGGQLSAMSALCTHAGCKVEYQGGGLYCPCHGSVFNARTGAVEQGPANQPLPRRRVIERDGRIYALPA